MSTQKPAPGSPLLNLDDAFLENILESPENDLRAELIEEGYSPQEVIARTRALLQAAEEEYASHRLKSAKRQFAAFREGGEKNVLPLDRDKQRARLAAMRSGAPATAGMMMAARKGNGLSERDEEGLLDDLADLERLSGRPRTDGHG
jgi:hypothetical protein